MPFTLTDLPFFIALPLLLVFSAFFSGSETALFSLTGQQRFSLTRGGGIIARSLSFLLTNERTLLVTLMLGNMVINVLYFVVSSALLLKIDPGQFPVILVIATIAPLVFVIIFGEVLPKMVANISPTVWVKITIVPLYGVHRAVNPLAELLSRWVIKPLGRLIAPAPKTTTLSEDELGALLKMSQSRGVIGSNEQELLHDVIKLGQIKVKDIMIPRVEIKAIDIDAGIDVFERKLGEGSLSKFIAYEGSLDNVTGAIYTRQYLIAKRLRRLKDLRALIRNVRFIPEFQRVDQLLEEFRKTGTKLAIVVDEYGGTAGLITLKDVVERMVGDLDMDGSEDDEPEMVMKVSEHQWRVSGRLGIRDWNEAFGADELPTRISTVGGLVMSELDRIPAEGDVVHLANVRIEVETMEGGRVAWVKVSVLATGDGEAARD